MKELTIEEKAKRYDEAITKGKQILNIPYTAHWDTMKEVVEHLFPELKESEDERMRNAAIDACKYMVDNFENSTKQYEDAIAWLEKQGEQKSDCGISSTTKQKLEESLNNALAVETGESLNEFLDEQKSTEWSEEDEDILKQCLYFFNGGKGGISDNRRDEILNWLKSLKDRVVPQPKQGWSEEDVNTLNRISSILVDASEVKNWWKESRLIEREEMITLTDFLKSLRPQNWTKEDKERYISCLQRLGTGNPEQPETINSKWFKEHVYPQSRWKPSEEYIECLSDAITSLNYPSPVLVDLLEQLKKLREEQI